MSSLLPGPGQSDPAAMKELRKIAAKSERLKKFDTPVQKLVSRSFMLRRLATVFFPDRQDVRVARKFSGKGFFRQCIERLTLLLLFRQEPRAYYEMALFMPERYARAGEFIDYRQLSYLNFLLNQKKSTIYTEDKVLFAEFCTRNNIPTPQILTVLEPDKTASEYLECQLSSAAEQCGVFFKPRFGLKGQGAGRLSFDGRKGWSLETGDGKFPAGSWQQIFEKLSDAKEPLIFQQRLKSHPVLAELSPETLHTVRLITYRAGDQVKPLEAMLRLGRGGSITDNLSRHGIGAPIDLQTAELGLGTSTLHEDLPLSIRAVSEGAKNFEGLKVPYFAEAVALGLKLHEALPEIFSLGHDIAILSDGPTILETNHIWGHNQDILDVGLGSYREFVESIRTLASREENATH